MEEQHQEQLTTAELAGTGRREDVEGGGAAFVDSNTTDAREDRGMAPTERADRSQAPLFPPDEAQQFRSRWDNIQASFVDEPRRSVEQADSLIAEVMKSLASSFAAERQNLESQWDSGDDVSTEDLRVGLQRYRSFFDRLLSV